MENLLNSDLVLVVLGILTTTITQFTKNNKIPTIYIVVFLSLFFGAGYFFFAKLVSPDLQKEIINSATKILSTSVIVYEFLIKKFETKNLK